MRTYSELIEILGKEDTSTISAGFCFRIDSSKLLPKNTRDHPEHQIWKELTAFQKRLAGL